MLDPFVWRLVAVQTARFNGSDAVAGRHRVEAGGVYDDFKNRVGRAQGQ